MPSNSYARRVGNVAYHAGKALWMLDEAIAKAPAADRPELERLRSYLLIASRQAGELKATVREGLCAASR